VVVSQYKIALILIFFKQKIRKASFVGLSGND